MGEKVRLRPVSHMGSFTYPVHPLLPYKGLWEVEGHVLPLKEQKRGLERWLRG